MKYYLSKRQISEYDKNGFIICKNFFYKEDIKKLIEWMDEVENFKEVKGKWMKYFDPSLKNKKKIYTNEN